MDPAVVERKLEILENLIENEWKEIVVLEVRIRARKESMKTLPDDSSKPVQVERINAEISKFQEQITGKEFNIEVMGKMIAEYKKIK